MTSLAAAALVLLQLLASSPRVALAAQVVGRVQADNHFTIYLNGIEFAPDVLACLGEEGTATDADASWRCTAVHPGDDSGWLLPGFNDGAWPADLHPRRGFLRRWWDVEAVRVGTFHGRYFARQNAVQLLTSRRGPRNRSDTRE